MAEEPATVDAYIAGFPPAVRDRLTEIREVIHRAIPAATEAISYKIPVFRLDGRNVVFFAGWKDHLSVYPVPEGDAEFEAAVAPYRSGRGTLKFPLDRPVPYDLVAGVAVRLAQRG
ncbi:iron chaperone [Nocardia stercoris]|uniref:DUF1801 domain-containing protein n=1 Tax=Nocardia stercoris TaxID=2483361 RepID=A0A3M2L659_9NOCA|nr:DUF1801 domain-containing protein [Nocardia stercoris]RMI30048.1 DUF1801 domain-containing protein [Nocardia stercoris]